MSLEFVTFDEYRANGMRTNRTHWSLAPGSTYQERWPYHAAAIELLKGLHIKSPSDVIEIGTYGGSLVKGSDVLDIPSSKPRCQGEYRLTITHDLRIFPWPITKKYRALVALRVWHHLMPVQREAFAEAKRVAENIIIVCPEETYRHRIGITRWQFTEWNGREPDYVADIDDMGPIYLFKQRDQRSRALDLQTIKGGSES